MRTSEKHIFYRLFLLLTAAAALTILGLYVHAALSVSEAPRYSLAVSERVVRGSIYDREHRLLAAEVPVYSLTAWKPDIRNMDAAAETAAMFSSYSADEARSLLESRQGFIYIRRAVPHSEAMEIQEHLSRHRIAGLSLEKSYGRVYPYHDLAAQTIGFINVDRQGALGIEQAWEEQLYPLPDPFSQITFGSDITLTLSVPFQAMLDDAAAEVYAHHRPDSVSGIIMDGKTGDILALTSYPAFNANTYQLSTPQQRTNYPVTAMYEPGSVFKVFSLASILDEGSESYPRTFHCTGTHTLALGEGRTAVIRCVTPHGTVNYDDIIKYSCNIAIAQVAMHMDSREFYEKITSFGFGRRTGIGLPGESPGSIALPEAWSLRSKPTIAFGQELGTTALQIASAATALVNGGVLLEPHLILEVTSASGEVTYRRERSELRQVISSDTADRLIFAMETAVGRGGTANRLHTVGIPIAAKTGTAQLLDPATGLYSQDRYLASTLALIPAADTTYIIYLAADYPKAGTIYGANIAVPAIKQIVDRALVSGYLSPLW